MHSHYIRNVNTVRSWDSFLPPRKKGDVWKHFCNKATFLPASTLFFLKSFVNIKLRHQSIPQLRFGHSCCHPPVASCHVGITPNSSPDPQDPARRPHFLITCLAHLAHWAPVTPGCLCSALDLCTCHSLCGCSSPRCPHGSLLHLTRASVQMSALRRNMTQLSPSLCTF